MFPKFALISAILAACTPIQGKTGDTLYATEESTLIKVEPKFYSEVIVSLDKGHELTEIYQKGSWIMVATSEKAETTGWVLAPKRPQYHPRERPSPAKKPRLPAGF